MAFGTTLTLTINAVAKVLNRINDSEKYSSEYLLRTATEEYRVKIRHSQEAAKGVSPLLRGIDRHNMEISHTIFATATTPQIFRQFYTVIRCSPGDDPAVISLFAQGAAAYAGNASRIDDQIAWMN